MSDSKPHAQSTASQLSTTSGRVPIFLLSPPRTDWGLRGRANFRSRQAGATDAARARREWTRLADAIVAAGGEVLVLPPHPDAALTGMIYTAEAGEFYRTEDGRPGFLLPNMASKHRRAEATWIAEQLQSWGFVVQKVGEDGAPLWEAQGDAIRAETADKIIHTYGVGPDARTDSAAYQAVADLLSPQHIHLRFDANPWFHGNTFLNIYRAHDAADLSAPDRDLQKSADSAAKNAARGPDRGARHSDNPVSEASDGVKPALMVVCPEALSAQEYARLRAFSPGPGVRVHEISREDSLGYDTNALQVNGRVIAPTSLSAGTDAAMRRLGLEVARLDLSELFVKGGGAPVCLSNRLWGLRLEEVPEAVRWSRRPTIQAHEAGRSS